MIPRYAPTYTYKDLLSGLNLSSTLGIENDLITQLKSLYNVRHVFLFGSGREAIFALLKAYNRPGHAVIPAYNCIVVPEAIQFAGYTPVFVDIDRKTLSMTAENVKKAITPDVQVVFLTHIFGIPCEVKEILNVLHERDILIVEDAAPALGAEYQGQFVGRFGDSAIISFQSTKVISGEAGGALIVNNDNLASKVRDLQLKVKKPASSWNLFTKALARKVVINRKVYSAAQYSYRKFFGEQMFEVVKPQIIIPPGYLTHCPKFASTLILMQIDKLDWNLSRRRKIANIYQNELSGCAGLMLPMIPEDCSPTWIQFPIMTKNKWELYKHMQQNQVDLTWTYRYSCADSYGLNNCTEAHNAAKTVLGLPTYPSLTDSDAQYICDTVKMFFADRQ